MHRRKIEDKDGRRNAEDQREENDSDQGWQEVKKTTRQSIRKDDWRKKMFTGKNVTTFYVSNIPNACKHTDLHGLFSSFGEIADVYVAGRKDKSGCYFGFVRFINVRDKNQLEMELKDLKIMNAVLSINLAKYDLFGNQVEQHVRIKKLPQQNEKPWNHYQQQPDNRNIQHGHRPFLDALLRNTNNAPNDIVINLPPSDFNSLKTWRLYSVVGRTISLQTLTNIHLLMKEAGVKNVDIRYLGGLNILLTFIGTKLAKDFIENINLWKHWFTKVDIWRGQSLAYERIAWIRVHGVPIQLWDCSVIEKIGERFGKVIQQSDVSSEDGNLSYGTIGLLVSHGKKISGEVVLKWKDKAFRCWISEEEEEWAPNFLTREDDMPETAPIPVKVSKINFPAKETISNRTDLVENREEKSISPCRRMEIEEPLLGKSTKNVAPKNNSIYQFNSQTNADTSLRSSACGPTSPPIITTSILDPPFISRKRARTCEPFVDENPLGRPTSFSIGSKVSSIKNSIPDLNTHPHVHVAGDINKATNTRKIIKIKEAMKMNNQVPIDMENIVQLTDQEQVGGHSTDDVDQELEATIAIGEIIGADLIVNESLIREVIVEEECGNWGRSG
ncbi:hypothetical protein E3N88_26039 [Mikania micrantha]|uniref:RRM domain-containing protein n=1 Tax=Mikania micrantha TaxID=192012 RepID=A0A5N6N825_9ASTR|nr:hypothetical protein E3N88_26039 [Mikania micrantha]